MKNNLTISILLATLLVSCGEKDMFSNIHAVANTTVPLGTAIISDSSLFATTDLQKQLKTDPQGVLYFSVEGSNTLLNANNIKDVFKLEQQLYDFNFNMPLPPNPLPEVDITPLGLNQPYYMEVEAGERIDELRLATGKVTFKLYNGVSAPKLRCTIPQITKDGQPLVISPGQTIYLDKSYFIKPDQNNVLPNRIDLKLSGYTPYINKLSGEVVIEGSEIYNAIGFLGSKNVVSQTITITPDDQALEEFFGNAKYVRFSNPKMELMVGNELNAPMMVELVNFTVNNKKIALKPTLNSSKFLIKGMQKTAISISNANTVSGTGLSDVISQELKNVVLELSVKLNPTAEDLGQSSYVQPMVNIVNGTDTLGVNYEIMLPLDCVIEDVKTVQEIGLNLSDMAENKDVIYQEFAMRITGYNQMPIDVKLNPYITTDNKSTSTPIYLLDQPIAINAAPSYLKPGTAGFKPFEILPQDAIITVIDQTKIAELLNAKMLFLQLTTSTYNAASRRPVKFYSPSEMGLNITIGAKADINISPKNN